MTALRNGRGIPSGTASGSLRRSSIGWALVLVLGLSVAVGQGRPQKPVTPIRIAVFDFELEDVTPAASFLNEATSSATSLERATSAARQELAQSGRYDIVDVGGVHADPVAKRRLRECDGCEAAIARELGADQSMFGIVRRATQTDYYLTVIIRDARSGKLVDEQGANFAGGEEGWASGARMLIRHQVLASPP
jgi:hypothetical protein